MSVVEFKYGHLINIIGPTDSWILQRECEELVEKIPGITLNGAPRQLNYFNNYAMYDHEKYKQYVNAAHFTHLEQYGHFKDVFINNAKLIKYASVLPGQVGSVYVACGGQQYWHVRPGVDERLRKDNIVFGVVGSVKPTGRKGEHLVAQLVKQGFDIRAWGSGWPVSKDKTKTEWEDLPSFYKEIDYLLIPSVIEGGPIPLIDAIVAGKPVIAPMGVGWCDEFPCIRYIANDISNLSNVLYKLTNPPTWDDWVNDHILMFRDILSLEKLI